MMRSYCFFAVLLLVALGGCSIFSVPQSRIDARTPKTTIVPAKNKSTQEINLQPASGVKTDQADVQTADKNQLPAESFQTFPVHRGGISSLAVTPDGFGAYTGSDDGTVTLSRVDPAAAAVPGGAKSVTTEVVFEETKPVLALGLSPDGTRLAVAQTSSIIIFDTKTREPVHTLTLIKGRITALSWDPRGELVAFGMATGDVYVWSLQQGFFEPQGEDSLDAVEHYVGGVSSIVSIVFHPSGRALFVGEEAGVVSLWRLLRTESEMGLRDKFNLDDQKLEATSRQRFASLASPIQDIWLSPEGRMLYVAASDGGVYAWKVRGLINFRKNPVSKDELLSITGAEIGAEVSGKKADRVYADLVVISGRDQKLQFFCRARDRDEAVGAAPPAFYDDDSDLTFVGSSVLFPRPLAKVRLSGASGLIWATEKSTNVYLFDAKVLFRSLGDSRKLAVCQG